MSRKMAGCLVLLTAALLTACGDDSDDDPFAAVDELARTAFDSQGIDGGLAVYNQDGVKVFERMYGDFSPDERVAIASASKLVSGVTLFRLIDQGYLSLDSTTAQTLGWTGEKGNITLRHLLSFTSGLPPENSCTYQSALTLTECVDSISQSDLVAAPGARFDYGSTHLAVAARMAEVVTGSTWKALFAAQIREPLGLPADIEYYANPILPVATDNPLLAGGLIVSMNEYERLLRLVFNKGQWQGNQLIAPAIFDTQTIAPYPDAVIGQSPGQLGIVRYGLTAWLECATPATGCDKISSPGAFGFTPWVDRENRYYAILGMAVPNDVARGFAVQLEQDLQPLIIDALARY
jgi:serine-type D-Ala-D-Ala carboxypeptidase/endopeptidase